MIARSRFGSLAAISCASPVTRFAISSAEKSGRDARRRLAHCRPARAAPATASVSPRRRNRTTTSAACSGAPSRSIASGTDSPAATNCAPADRSRRRRRGPAHRCRAPPRAAGSPASLDPTLRIVACTVEPGAGEGRRALRLHLLDGEAVEVDRQADRRIEAGEVRQRGHRRLAPAEEGGEEEQRGHAGGDHRNAANGAAARASSRPRSSPAQASSSACRNR